MGGRRGPWLVSVGVHIVIGTVLILLIPSPPPSNPLRMRLVSSSAAPAAPRAVTAMSAPGSGHPSAAEPALPGWQAVAPSAAALPPASVPVSLDELLGPELKRTEPEGTWGADGSGYAPPPLPPPGLAPPQGARWELLLAIPAGGGFARSMEGLDSGHPELDRWLEEYLRTVSFPSNLDGTEYQLRWRLRLEAGKPR